MICPRCGNEWDASKSPCTRCGLVIRIPGQPGPLGRSTTPTQQNISQQSDGSSGLPLLRPQSSGPLGRPSPGNLSSNAPVPSRESTMVPKASQFPTSTQAPNTPRPYNFPPLPETPRSSSPFPYTSISDAGHDDSLNRTLPQAQPNFGQAAAQQERRILMYYLRRMYHRVRKHRLSWHNLQVLSARTGRVRKMFLVPVG